MPRALNYLSKKQRLCAQAATDEVMNWVLASGLKPKLNDDAAGLYAAIYGYFMACKTRKPEGM